jgi:hypothetical protein
MKLTYVTEKGFLEVYKNWVGFGFGSMLIYIEPPTEKSRRAVCEYVMFKEDDSYKKVVINKDLLDLYNRGE